MVDNVTRAEVGLRDWMHVHLIENLVFQAKLALGGIPSLRGDTLVKADSSRLDKSRELYEQYQHSKSHRLCGPLSNEEVRAITEAEEQEVEGSMSRRVHRNKMEMRHTEMATKFLFLQQAGVALLYDVVEGNSDEIDSVVNIGARIDAVSAFLAQEFPDIEFISVDFQSGLEEANSEYPDLENRSYRSGYELDLLKNGSLKADVSFCTSTNSLFRAGEMDECLDELTEICDWVVFNESWYPQSLSVKSLKIQRPEEVDPEKPYIGGQHSNYHHNHVEKLNRRGFDIVHSEIVPIIKSNRFYLQLVATGS
jgi:hypothetical protein